MTIYTAAVLLLVACGETQLRSANHSGAPATISTDTTPASTLSTADQVDQRYDASATGTPSWTCPGGSATSVGTGIGSAALIRFKPRYETSDDALLTSAATVACALDELGFVGAQAWVDANQSFWVTLVEETDVDAVVAFMTSPFGFAVRPVIAQFPTDDPSSRHAAAALLESMRSDATQSPTSTSGSARDSAAPELSEILTDALSADSAGVVAFEGVNSESFYVLGPAQARGEVIESATAEFSDNRTWTISIIFTSAGSEVFDALAAAYVGRQIAIVVGSVVVTAPTINSVEFNGTAVISGSFDEADARRLAFEIQSALVPALEVVSIQVLSSS